MFKCKWFISGVIMSILVVCLMGMSARKDYWDQQWRQSYINKVITKSGLVALTNYELLNDTDLPSGSIYVIDSVIFSSIAANALYLNDSGTAHTGRYGPYRVPANSTIIDRDIVLKLNAGAALYMTTIAAGEVTIQYRVEK